MSNDLDAFEEQLIAMRAVMEALKPLNEEGRASVLAWVNGQLGGRAVRPLVPENSVVAAHGLKREGTVSVVAQRLNARSARDLLLSAAAHLTLYQGKDSFSKEELIACAKEARSWKSSYSNQMASNIVRMIKAGTFFERAKNVFSLSDSALADAEGRLGQ